MVLQTNQCCCGMSSSSSSSSSGSSSSYEKCLVADKCCGPSTDCVFPTTGPTSTGSFVDDDITTITGFNAIEVYTDSVTGAFIDRRTYTQIPFATGINSRHFVTSAAIPHINCCPDITIHHSRCFWDIRVHVVQEVPPIETDITVQISRVSARWETGLGRADGPCSSGTFALDQNFDFGAPNLTRVVTTGGFNVPGARQSNGVCTDENWEIPCQCMVIGECEDELQPEGPFQWATPYREPFLGCPDNPTYLPTYQGQLVCLGAPITPSSFNVGGPGTELQKILSRYFNEN